MSGFGDRLKNSTALRVLAVYLGASWVVLQVVDVVKQNMGLPDWVFPFALLLVIGLPVMLTTAVLQGRPAAPAGGVADVPVGTTRVGRSRAPTLLHVAQRPPRRRGGAGAPGRRYDRFHVHAEPAASARWARWWPRACSRSVPAIVLAEFDGGIRFWPSTVTESFRADLDAVDGHHARRTGLDRRRPRRAWAGAGHRAHRGHRPGTRPARRLSRDRGW